uniref:PDZ domain-containing protein n=1 Tax=Aureoumbra lagunensis TaxID=44058 RepID=A0A7S3NMX6_9STRA
MEERNDSPSSSSSSSTREQFIRLRSTASKLARQASEHTAKGIRQAAEQSREFAKKINEEPGRATARRLVNVVLGDWVDGGVGAQWEEDSSLQTTTGGINNDEEIKTNANTGASLRVAWRKGEIELKNIKLKSKALEGLGLGQLKVVQGFIERAIIIVPWTKLGSSAVRLSLHGVTLQLEPNTEDCLPKRTSTSTNTDILELVDELRQKLGAATSSARPLRGSLFRRSARRVALRALSSIEIKVTGLQISYNQLLGCRFDFAEVSLVSSSLGDSFTTIGSLEKLKVFQSNKTESGLASLTNLQFRLGEERVANIQPSGLQITEPFQLLLAVIETRTSLRNARRLFDASTLTKNRYNDNKHYQFRRAVIAIMNERKQALRRWFEAVDLLILRAEYLACRANDVSKAARKRAAEIEASTPLRTLLAFRCEPDEFETTATTESIAIVLESTDAVVVGDIRLVGVRLASTDDKPIDNCRINIQSSSGLLKTADISFNGMSRSLVFSNPFAIDIPDSALSLGDLKALLGSDDQATPLRFTASAPAAKVTLSHGLTISLTNPCFCDSALSVDSIALDGVLDLSATELHLATDRVRITTIVCPGLKAEQLEYMYQENELSIASLRLAEPDVGKRLIEAWRQLKFNFDGNTSAKFCANVTDLSLGEVLRAKNIYYNNEQGLKWKAANIGGQALITSGCNVFFSDADYRVEFFETCKCRPSAALVALTSLFRDWRFWSLTHESENDVLRREWVVKIPTISLRVEPPETSEDDIVQEEELEAIDLDAPQAGSTAGPLLVAATDLQIDSDWQVLLAAVSVASISNEMEKVLAANSLRIVWSDALIKVVVSTVTALESVRFVSIYFSSPSIDTKATGSPDVELCISQLNTFLFGTEIQARDLVTKASSDVISTSIHSISIHRKGNLLVKNASLRAKVDSEAIELSIKDATEVYVALSDLQGLSLGGASESRRRLSLSIAAETRLFLCGINAPALRIALRDVVFETRPGHTAGLTLTLAGLDSYDDRKEHWQSLLLEPSQLCFQHLPEEARLCLREVRLCVDSRLVSAISRLCRVSESLSQVQSEFYVSNECGVEIQVNDSLLANGESLKLKMASRAEMRHGAPSPGLELGTSRICVPLPRRALVSGIHERLLIPGWRLEIELTQGMVRLRSAQKLKNDCADKLVCRIVNNDDDDLAVSSDVDTILEIAPGDEADIPLSWLQERHRLVVWRENIDAEWLDCGDLISPQDSEWLDCSDLLTTQEEDQAILWCIDDKNISSSSRQKLLQQKKLVHRHRSLRYSVTCQKWEQSNTRVSRSIVVSPRRRLTNRLSVTVRVATARKWPESRQDYADLFDVQSGARCDLGDARFWCLRLEGYASQSDWQECSAVLQDERLNESLDESPPSARFVVRSEERGALAVELRRRNKHQVGELELVCLLTMEDRGTGLDLDLETRMLMEANESEALPLHQRECVYRRGPVKRVMLDVSPHAAVVAVSRRFEFGPIPPRSSPLVLAAALARNQASTTTHSRVALAGPDGLFELGFFQPDPRLVVFVPRLLLVNEMKAGGADVVVRQAGINVYRASRAAPGEIAPIYWDRPSAPFALDFGLALSDRAIPQQWTTVSASRFEETNLSEVLSPYDRERGFGLMVRRGTSRATFELVVCDIVSYSMDIPAEEVGINRNHLNLVQRLLTWSQSLRLEIESLELALTDALLTVKTPTGFSATLRRGEGGVCRGTVQLQAIAIIDERTRGIAFQNYYDEREDSCFKLTGRFSPGGMNPGSLAIALELGDSALDLDEAAAWRLLDAFRLAGDAWGDSQLTNSTQTLYEAELVRLGGWKLRPATIRADAAARRRLLEVLDDLEGPVNVLTRNLVAALPKLGLENAEFLFEPCELRPRRTLTLSDLASEVGRTYAAQLKRQWFSLASSLSITKSRSAPSSVGASHAIANARRPPLVSPPPPPQSSVSAYLFEYSVFVEESGALGLVLNWRDGIVSVAQTKKSSDEIAVALAPIRAGDVILAINGTSAQQYSSSEELVSVLRLRPLTIHLTRPRVALLDILVPATEPSLGFSIARRVVPSVGSNPVLVVTDVRAQVAAARAGVQPGSRLIAINGEPVAHLDLDDLIAKAKPLSHTDRTVSIAMDNSYHRSEQNKAHPSQTGSANYMSVPSSSTF